MPAPLFSVLICVYNGEKFLARTLDSALTQTHRDFELIAVDDRSTDGSLAILNVYRDPRLRVIRLDENRGAAAALDQAIQMARGVYVALLDQDDLWDPDYLAAHLKLLEANPRIALSFSWFCVIDQAGNEIGIHSARHRGTIGFADLLQDFVIGATSNVVIRKAAIEQAGGVDTSLPRLYDLDLCLRVALLADGNIEALPRDLMRYRRHTGQISRNAEALLQEWAQVLEKMRPLAPVEVARVEKRACSNMSRYFARIAFESGHYAFGIPH